LAKVAVFHYARPTNICEADLNQILFHGLKSKLIIYLMNSVTILHSHHHINPTKFINHFNKGEKYFKHFNNYLIPYHCKDVNHNNRLVIGKFIYPMWATIERAMLTKSNEFNYTYIKGKDFTIEYMPSSLTNYHIFGTHNVYPNGILANNMILQPNSILLFPIHKDIATPLINNQLL
jgi:hypothetical protein